MAARTHSSGRVIPPSQLTKLAQLARLLVVFTTAIAPPTANIAPSIPSVAPTQTQSPENPLSATTIEPQSGGPWTNFSTADGLASDSIFALDLASSGHLWVGTNAGLSILSLEGDWLTLTSGDGLGGDIVADIARDPSNPHYHWFATDGGGTLLDDGGNPMDKSVHNWVTFGKADGLVEYDVSAVAVDAAGRVWFGTDRLDENGNETGFGISVLNTSGTPLVKTDDTWTTYTATVGSLSNNVIHDIVVDGQGVVWIATQNGLNAFSADTWTAYYTSDGLPSNDIRALLVAGNLLWIATKGGAAVLSHGNTPHSKADDQWTTYTQYNSYLAANDTKALAMDSAGRVWIGTNWLVSGGDSGAGVSVLDPKGTPFNRNDDTWTTFTTSNGLAHNAVRAVVTSGSNTAWMGTRQGLSRLDYSSSPFSKSDDRWTTYSASQRLAGSSVYATAGTSATAMWLGTEAGLSYLEYNASPHMKRDDAWATYTTADYLPADGIRALAVDNKGRVWIGTAAGLMVRDTRGTPTNKADDYYITYNSSYGLIHDQVNDIVIDGAGRGWIACGSYFTGGLHVLDIGNSLTSRYDDMWATFTQSNSSLPNPYVTAVALDGNSIAWLGTQGGAARLSYGSSPFNKSDDVWTIFNSGNSGLAYNTIRDVAVDPSRNVWFGLAIEGVSAYSSINGSWVIFKQADGLAYDAVKATAVDRAGNLWLGTDGGGVSVLNYQGTLTNKGDDVWTTYTGDGPLLSGNINTVVMDRWGQVWLGTFGGGASIYSTVQFSRVYLPVIQR